MFVLKTENGCQRRGHLEADATWLRAVVMLCDKVVESARGHMMFVVRKRLLSLQLPGAITPPLTSRARWKTAQYQRKVTYRSSNRVVE